MPKNIDDVILPERRRSIRNIPIPEGRRKLDKTVTLDSVKKRPTAPEKIEFAEMPPEPSRRALPHRYSRNKRKKVWTAVGGALLILAFAILSMFDRATLAYTPKSLALNFTNEIFSAVKTGEGELLYSVVKLSGDKGQSVSASGETDVSRKASGTIVVYNDTATEQALIENTRFESTAGKVYRIQKGIVIPKKVEAQPGSLEVMVYADVAGAAYNSNPTDFTVPGLKGTPRYNTVYARSKTPIAGGFVGKEKAVSETDLEKTTAELKAALTKELFAKAEAEVPVDFILSPTLSTVEFETLPQSASESKNSVTVNLRGNLYGIMFKKTELAKELSHNKTILQANEIVDMDSFDQLKFSFSGTAPADLLTLSKINFKVEGPALLLWRTDEVALKSDLMGRQEKDVASILKNYPTIASADAILRPFWKRSFPKEAEKVSIKKLKAQ